MGPFRGRSPAHLNALDKHATVAFLAWTFQPTRSAISQGQLALGLYLSCRRAAARHH